MEMQYWWVACAIGMLSTPPSKVRDAHIGLRTDSIIEYDAPRVHVQMFPVHRVVTRELLNHFQDLLNVAYSGEYSGA